MIASHGKLLFFFRYSSRFFFAEREVHENQTVIEQNWPSSFVNSVSTVCAANWL
jgi:hypothetical protein